MKYTHYNEFVELHLHISYYEGNLTSVDRKSVVYTGSNSGPLQCEGQQHVRYIQPHSSTIRYITNFLK